MPQLSILTAGPTPPNPAELLSSGRMRRFLEALLVGQRGWGDLGAVADVVVIDTPPATAFVDAAVIAGQADGTILVVDGSKSRAGHVMWTKDTLSRARARILGVVLIQAPSLWGAASKRDITEEPVDERSVIEPEPGSAKPQPSVTQAVER